MIDFMSFVFPCVHESCFVFDELDKAPDMCCINASWWNNYFRNLREMFNIDAADYMMSICGGDGLRELSTSGKSGSLFYVSLDDKFVIKTLRTSELKVWI